MRTYTFDLGNRVVDVKASTLENAKASISHYGSATLTHIDDIAVAALTLK